MKYESEQKESGWKLKCTEWVEIKIKLHLYIHLQFYVQNDTMVQKIWTLLKHCFLTNITDNWDYDIFNLAYIFFTFAVDSLLVTFH